METTEKTTLVLIDVKPSTELIYTFKTPDGELVVITFDGTLKDAFDHAIETYNQIKGN